MVDAIDSKSIVVIRGGSSPLSGTLDIMKNLIVTYSDQYKGLGVFAEKDYKIGELVNIYDISKKIKKIDYDNLMQDQKWRYCFDKENKVAYELDETTKRINHSCDPNIGSNEYGLDFAIKNIKKGDEITAEYMNYNPTGLVCLCGSSNCIGKISF